MAAGLLISLAVVLGVPVGAGAEEEAAPAWTAHSDGLAVTGISSLRIHPDLPDLLVAYLHGAGPAHSEDGGLTWTVHAKGIDTPIGPRSSVRISFDPRDRSTWYCVVDGHIYQSDDTAKSWKKISSQTHESYSWDQKRTMSLCYEVRVSPSKSVRLAVGTRFHPLYNGGLYMSLDQGKEWDLVAGSKNAKSGLASTCRWVRLDPRTDKNVLVAGEHGVWSSDDRGVTFEALHPPMDYRPEVRGISHLLDGAKELYLAEATGVWMSKGMGKKWSKKPVLDGDAVGVYVDAANRKRVYAILHDRGLLVSENASRGKWQGLGGEGGYADAEPRELLSHPREKKRLMLTSPVTGLHVSEDRGATWKPVEGNAPAIAPAVRAVGIHPDGDGSILAIEEHGVVFRSGGAAPYKWERVGRLGMMPRALIPMPGKAGHWLATGARLLHSEDNGATWKVLLQPTTAGEQISDVEIGAKGELYALELHTGAVQFSDNLGKTWKAVKGPKMSPANLAVDLALNQENPQHMLLATRSANLPWRPADLDGGVWETWNGGKKWTSMNDQGLAPGRKENPRERLAKYGWNFAKHVYIDCQRKIMMYVADGGGFFVRALVDPKKDKPEHKPAWMRLSPEAIPQARFGSLLRMPDGGYVAQLLGMDEASALVKISGDAIKAGLDHAVLAAHAKKQDEVPEAPATWSPLPLPEQEGGAAFEALAVDPKKPDRLLAYEGRLGAGISIWEVPPPPAEDEGEAGEEEEDDDAEEAAAPNR